jgi:hypothetical protein
MRGRRIAFDHGAMMVSSFHMVMRRLTRRNDKKSYAERDAKRRCLTHFAFLRAKSLPAIHYEKAATAIKRNIFCE